MPEPRSAEAWTEECHQRQHTLVPKLQLICPDCARAFAAQECAAAAQRLVEDQAKVVLSYRDRAIDAEAMVKALQQRAETLKKYTRHKHDCGAIWEIRPSGARAGEPTFGLGKCSCGLEAALRGGETG